MSKTIEQTEDELAQKCAAGIRLIERFGYTPMQWTQLVAEFIKKELNLAELLRDRERLDWITKHRAQLNCTMGAPGNFHYQVGTLPSEHNYRAAIDAEIKRMADSK